MMLKNNLSFSVRKTVGFQEHCVQQGKLSTLNKLVLTNE